MSQDNCAEFLQKNFRRRASFKILFCIAPDLNLTSDWCLKVCLCSSDTPCWCWWWTGHWTEPSTRIWAIAEHIEVPCQHQFLVLSCFRQRHREVIDFFYVFCKIAFKMVVWVRYPLISQVGAWQGWPKECSKICWEGQKSHSLPSSCSCLGSRCTICGSFRHGWESRAAGLPESKTFAKGKGCGQVKSKGESPRQVIWTWWRIWRLLRSLPMKISLMWRPISKWTSPREKCQMPWLGGQHDDVTANWSLQAAKGWLEWSVQNEVA